MLVLNIMFKSLDYDEWAGLVVVPVFILVLAVIAKIEIGPSRKEILEKGDKKEVAILYIADDEGSNRWKSTPTVHMEDGRSVKINMNNVVLSDDGIDRAVVYDFDWKLPVIGVLDTYSEYILYLTPETLQKAGITLPSDLISVTGTLVPGENQTEYDITPETEK